MRKLNFIVAGAVIAIGSIVFACNSETPKSEDKAPILSQAEMIKRGEYLVATIGCDDCHSPKRMSAKGPELISELRLSGYPADRPLQKPDANAIKSGWMLFGPDLTSAAGPCGVSFSANILLTAPGSVTGVKVIF